MPREHLITSTCGDVRREYVLVYEDDSPERAEAVHFFQENGDCLFPSMDIPLEVKGMPIEQANAYLRQHPIQERWCSLNIDRQSAIRDDDLARLRHLPEIRRVKISSNHITDAGIKHLLALAALDHLLLYSDQITDKCLSYIRTIRTLVALDLQAAPNISREAVLALVNEMPSLQDVWPPPDPVRLAECQRRNRLSRNDQPGHVVGPSRQADLSGPLRYVDFARRPLPRPPADLFDTDDIERLDLLKCGLEVLPDAIGNLTRLRTLYASWGRLTKLPTTIGRLTALEVLWLNDNQLTELPSSFSSLASLKSLSLDNNLLNEFPKAVLELKQLEQLRMTDNRMSALPERIGDLTELRSLSLGRNNLQTLPRSIRRLEKLTYLGLQGNPLSSLPDEVWRLPCLITLNLAHTGLTELPPAAANIPSILGLPGRRIHS